MRVCSVHGCPVVYPATEGSRCREHRKAAHKQRGSSSQRGYGSRGHARFRDAVLQRDPICVICHLAQTTEADHYPRGRDELVRLNLNPNDPNNGRGLCHDCHSRETARHQPGGWHQG